MGLFNRGGTAITPARTVNLVKDPTGAPAVNLTKVRDAGHIDLAKRADKAGLALSKRGLAGIRAQAILVLDHSGSMRTDYASGAVQTLVERALGFALQIDVDGTVPVIAFDSRVWPAVDVTVDSYRGVVDRDLWHRNQMGSTDLAGALRHVKGLAETTDQPLFVTVVTDGEPDNRSQATTAVCELARYPVFIKFLAVQPVAYLTELDDLGNDRRLLDNVDAKPSSPTLNLLTCSDAQFADAMVDESDTWVAAATKAGVLR